MHPTGLPLDVEQMRGQALFDGLETATLVEIARRGWIVEQSGATRILSRGDSLDGMYTVLDGRLKLYMLSCSGDERVLRVLRPGDSFGEAIMFNAMPSPVFVETLSAVKLGYVPRDAVADALARDPDFTASMLRNMSVLMRELIQDLESCCLQNARQRTTAYLLREADAIPPPHIEVSLPAPKSVIASTLNMSAETFSRELHRLQDEGFVTINRRTLYLHDRDALKRMAEGLAPETAG